MNAYKLYGIPLWDSNSQRARNKFGRKIKKFGLHTGRVSPYSTDHTFVTWLSNFHIFYFSENHWISPKLYTLLTWRFGAVLPVEPCKFKTWKHRKSVLKLICHLSPFGQLDKLFACDMFCCNICNTSLTKITGSSVQTYFWKSLDLHFNRLSSHADL